LAAIDIGLDRVVPDFLLSGAKWFLQSGIQEESGGVARYYGMKEARNARISTEITGYAVSTFLMLYKLTGDEAHREAAVRAGDFLCDRAWDARCGTFPFEWSADGVLPEHWTYFFDCGIITRGLVRLYRETGEAKYIQRAEECARAMLADFVNGTDIDPILELPSKRATERDSRWSRSPGCYQLKAAMGWLEVGEATGERRLVEAYEKALDDAMGCQEGFLTAEGPGDRVMDRLHAYGYYLEGLLPRAGVPEVRQALASGIETAAAHLSEFGSGFERSDVVAQLLRVKLLAPGAVAFEEGAALDEIRRIAAFQMSSSDRRVDGAFCFGRRGSDLLPFANPVSGAFCLQALAQCESRRCGDSPDWRELI